VRRAEDFDAAAADIAEIQCAFDQCGLAGPVFADQSEKFSGTDFKRQAGGAAALAYDLARLLMRNAGADMRRNLA